MSGTPRTKIGAGRYDAIIKAQYAYASRDVLQGWCQSWGVDIADIRRRAKVMGIRRDAGASRLAYSEASSEVARTRRLGVNPLDFYNPSKDRLGDKDDEYVSACIEQGGFPVLVWINGEPRTVYRAEWAA
jgi:hypothetical protein